MKRTIACGVLVVLAGLILTPSSLAADPPSKKGRRGRLRHVVLFKFTDETSPEDVKKIEEAFCELPSKIPTVIDFEWGTNNSPEGLADGFTHCFLVTFQNAKGREVYLPHPAHKAFIDVMKPHLDKVLVIDYAAKNRTRKTNRTRGGSTTR